MIKKLLSDKRKVIKYLILLLIMLELPSFLLVKVNSTLSSFLSILSYVLLIVYYLESRERTKPNMWLIFIGIIYFTFSTLSGQDFTPTPRFYLTYIFKYFIIIIGGGELVKNLTKNDLYYLLLIGSSSILLHIFLFFDPLQDSGRYSGFYLNPNNAGFICLVGYVVCFAYSGKKRLVGQIVFTLMGLLTLSRTFIILWLLMTLLSIKLNKRNIRVFLYGFLVAMTLVTFSDLLPISNPRLNELKNFIEGNRVNTKTVKNDSRSETWALYYEHIIDKPFFGNGFNSFSGFLIQGKIGQPVGVHNTFLKIVGEAGLLPLILFLIMFLELFKKSANFFVQEPHILMIGLCLFLFLLTNHNFFETNFMLLLLQWLFSETKRLESTHRITNINFRS